MLATTRGFSTPECGRISVTSARLYRNCGTTASRRSTTQQIGPVDASKSHFVKHLSESSYAVSAHFDAGAFCTERQPFGDPHELSPNE
jgi:hypothetical protein